MGFRVGFQCFASQADAEDYFYSQQPIIPMQIGSQPNYMQFQKSVDGWLQVTFVNNVVRNVVKVPAVNFPECSPSDSFSDGAQLGAFIGVMFVVAFGVKAVLNMIWRA